MTGLDVTEIHTTVEANSVCMETPWPVEASQTEYETDWFEAGYDLVTQPDGSSKRYYWATLAPAVVVVPITEDDHVLFVEQYRPTIQEQQYELPAGIVDEHDGAPGDRVEPAKYVTAGRRELREETGYRADDVTLVEQYAVATGVLRHRRGIVVATGLTEGRPDRDDNEFLSVTAVPAAEALTLARSAPANDATIAGILLAQEDGYL